MVNFVLSAVVLVSAACQMSESDGEAKVTFGDADKPPIADKSPTYAEFKLSEYGDKVAHVAVKIVYKGEDPVEMHVKDLREDAKANPVEELAVDDANIYDISAKAKDGKQIFTFTFLSPSSKDHSLYGLNLVAAMGDDLLAFSGFSTEKFDGRGKFTEEEWDELTQETPAPKPTPAPLTRDEYNYLNSSCLSLLQRKYLLRGPVEDKEYYVDPIVKGDPRLDWTILAQRAYIYSNSETGCSHDVDITSPDVVRHMKKHGLTCRQEGGNFAIAKNNGGKLSVVNKVNEAERHTRLSTVVICSQTESVRFYMEGDKLHVHMVEVDGVDMTYVYD